VENKLKKEIQISLSIRISREAHIFLCDGDKIEKSNCYWFLLMAFGGSKTELRKCARGTIPVRNHIQIQKSCEMPIQTIKVSARIVVYLTSLCVNWAFFGTRGPLKRSLHSRFKRAHSCQKRPSLHTNELNTTFFGSTSLLKAPNRLKSLKLA
jgi:hypothetical protein